ncbi:MAG: SDR family oxidoreductase, partial [Spirochaetaceae bacterium]|nr:SDR family oxidoreductase [Spirochaetaceae bacterium]
AGREILDSCPRIDVLINSAGLHSTTLRRTAAGRELVFCVNHLASFLLTSLLLGRLVESAPSRIIQVNSEGHRFGGLDPHDLDWRKRHYTGLRSYGASKIAQLLTVKEFADRLAGSGVTINAMHPGDVRTGIGRNNGILYRIFLHTIIWPFLKDSSISGEALYWLAGDPGLAEVSGRYFHLTIEETPAPAARDGATGRKIWALSRELAALGPEIAR